MQQNPLFPSNDDGSGLPDYLRTGSQVPYGQNPQQPMAADPASGPSVGPVAGSDAAADMIRQKLAAIYAGAEQSAPENATTQPASPAQFGPAPASVGSKHQQFMQGLHASGRSHDEVQAAWHNYYAGLPDHEKHEVWQEFYAKSQQTNAAPVINTFDQTSFQAGQNGYHQPGGYQPLHATVQPLQPAAGQYTSAENAAYQPPRPFEPQPQPKQGKEFPSFADLKQRAVDGLKATDKLPGRHIFHSLAFGVSCGVVVLVIFMFGFFNEVIISPFIQPSSKGVETPVIVDPANSVAASSKTPEVIIPKINVEIPVDYSQTTTNEAAIETALESGVVHYPTTVMPGQNGNTAFFGHSSNNIFNPGKYKFAFVLLHKLVEGDTFYLSYNGKTYAYEVISHQIVEPTQVSVLGPVAGQTATATLITCDPPGTSLHRLVVVGKQVSPDPSGNTAPPAPNPAEPIITATETTLPGNGPTLLSRLWHSIF